ncbi:MAG: hypothetical protein Q4B04_06335 [bacterium]|nr:hypothetical protein [bacterium]
MSFETVLIISAAIEVITLICFFVLCSNVSALRKQVCKDNIPPSSLIAMYMGLGQKEKARDLLIDHIVNNSMLRDKLHSASEANIVLRPYQKLMDELGVNYDPDLAQIIKKSI